MIKILLITLIISCQTIPLPEAPKLPIPELPKIPTAPKPPVLTNKCNSSEFFLFPQRDIFKTPTEAYYFHKSHSLVSNKKKVYINYEGRLVKKGFRAGQSFIVCKKKGAFMGGSGISLERRKLINFYVKGYFKDVGVDIEVSDTLENSQMLEMIVGGRYRDLGCGRNSGILGVAPFDKGNRRIDEVGFAFVNETMSDYMIASTIAHEMAHTYGLDHIKNTCGVMYYAITDFIVGFKTGRIDGSLRKQNGKQTLRRNLK